MSSIVERCAVVSEALKTKEESEFKDFSLEQLAPLASRLRELHAGLTKQRDRAVAVGDGLDESKASSALANLVRVRAQIAQDPGLLIGGSTFDKFRDSVGDLVRHTNSTTDRHLAGLQAKWAQISLEYLELFKSIPRLEDVCEEGLRLAKDLHRDQSLRSTGTADGLREFLQRGQRLEEIEGLVNEFPCPVPVRQFLERAQGGGAPLALLVPETREWLEENDLLKKLKIRLA
jgi:hypothetical protein